MPIWFLILGTLTEKFIELILRCVAPIPFIEKYNPRFFLRCVAPSPNQCLNRKKGDGATHLMERLDIIFSINSASPDGLIRRCYNKVFGQNTEGVTISYLILQSSYLSLIITARTTTIKITTAIFYITVSLVSMHRFLQ